jgi:hypothetical protein
MSALSSIRKKCSWCSNSQPKEIQLCPAKDCPLWLYRLGMMPKIVKPSPLRAGRAKCLDCAEGPSDVKECGDVSCALYPYRLGKNPAYSEASRKEAGRRLKIRRLSEKSLSERAFFKETVRSL